MDQSVDIIIVGTGVAGLFCALNLPSDKKILMITKDEVEHSDSFLAQGGICVLKDANDFDSFFEDTMKVGHYKNNPASVKTMIESSPAIIEKLIGFGVEFEQENGQFVYTREGAHSTPRILYHEDLTGKEITSHLLDQVRLRENIEIIQHATMLDLLTSQNHCYGLVMKNKDGAIVTVRADYVVMATGGLGGLFEHSTNFSHLTGDALAISLKHDIKLKDISYIQIHPTSLYSKKPGRSFLISESLRGEGAILLNKNKERFVDELLPRDLLTNAIRSQMEKDNMPYVWLSLMAMEGEEIRKRFPNINNRCLEEGYDITKEPIPVTPAQHYFMGGVKVDLDSKTSMEHLYAIGETSCNGVHGANRLASNSLLESLVFAEKAAIHITEYYEKQKDFGPLVNFREYQNTDKIQAEYRQMILKEIERKKKHEQSYNHKVKCG